MSSTVITNTLVAAFKTKRGNIFYALLEETFEKNCYPHTPHWWCFGVAPLKETIQRIFYAASSFEGGMSQWKSGWGKPESFIAKFLYEIESPVDISHLTVRLDFGKNYLYAFEEEKVADIRALFSQEGYDHVLADVDARVPITFSLAEDGEILVKLIAAKLLSPGRVIRRERFNSDRDARIGYQPKKTKAREEVIPSVMKAGDGDLIIVQDSAGAWRPDNNAWLMVERYVTNAWEAELQNPGNYAGRIKAFRSAVKNAPKVPAGTKVQVDLSIPLDESAQERVQEFQNRCPVTMTATPTGYEFVPPLDDPRGDVMWYARFLPPQCTTWLFDQSVM